MSFVVGESRKQRGDVQNGDVVFFCATEHNT